MRRWWARMLVVALSFGYGCRDAPPGFGPHAPEDEVVGHWMDDGTAPKVVGMDSGRELTPPSPWSSMALMVACCAGW